MTGLGSMTLAQLYADRETLDRVARSISMEADVDYGDALGLLEKWAGAAASLAGHNDGSRLRLSTVLGSSPMTLDRLEADVGEVSGRTEGMARSIQLSADLPPEPDGEVETDELGNVLLSADSDRGGMLAHPVMLERAYQTARQLEDAYARPGGREKFEEDLRTNVEAGVDLVATLQHQQREAEVTARTLAAERKQLAREAHERQKRAEARALAR